MGLKTLEEVWEDLKKDPEIKDVIEKVDKMIEEAKNGERKE